MDYRKLLPAVFLVLMGAPALAESTYLRAAFSSDGRAIRVNGNGLERGVLIEWSKGIGIRRDSVQIRERDNFANCRIEKLDLKRRALWIQSSVEADTGGCTIELQPLFSSRTLRVIYRYVTN